MYYEITYWNLRSIFLLNLILRLYRQAIDELQKLVIKALYTFYAFSSNYSSILRYNQTRICEKFTQETNKEQRLLGIYSKKVAVEAKRFDVIPRRYNYLVLQCFSSEPNKEGALWRRNGLLFFQEHSDVSEFLSRMGNIFVH